MSYVVTATTTIVLWLCNIRFMTDQLVYIRIVKLKRDALRLGRGMSSVWANPGHNATGQNATDKNNPGQNALVLFCVGKC